MYAKPLTMLTAILIAALDESDDTAQQTEETSGSKMEAGAVCSPRPAGRLRLQKRASKLATTLSSWRSGHSPSVAQAAFEDGSLPKQQHSMSQNHSTWLEVCLNA